VIGWLDVLRARRPKYLANVLAPEVKQVLAAIEGGDGIFPLMAGLRVCAL
jgi:hypothetical protein